MNKTIGVNKIDEYIEKVDRFKQTLLQNIDMNDLRHLSSEEFDMCKQALDLFDATINIIWCEMLTLELIEKRTELIAKQNELISDKLNKIME